MQNDFSVFRKQHQPEAPSQASQGIAGQKISTAELQKSCGVCGALVLAINCGEEPLRIRFDEEDAPDYICDGSEEDEATDPKKTGLPRPLQRYHKQSLLAHTCTNVLDAQFAAMGVVAGGSKDTHTAISKELQLLSQKRDCNIKLFPYEAQKDWQSTCGKGGFELFGLSYYLLTYARDLLRENPQLEAVLIMECDQVRFTPAHLKRLCDTFAAVPHCEAVTSWVEWLRRMPILFSRSLLESLDSPRFIAKDSHKRPLPSLKVEEVVFGEEKLAANAPLSKSAQNFAKSRTLSAREAVRKARAAQKRAGEDEKFKEAEKLGESEKLKEADALLVRIAKQVTAALDAMQSEVQKEELHRADRWAWRNRQDFALLQDPDQCKTLAYLDSAATSQRANCVLQAQHHFDTSENANIYRAGYALSAKATARFNEARATIEKFIGAKRRELVFTANTSAAANLVAQAWGEWNIQAGDLIVCSIEEHHSNILPWLMLAQRKQAHLAYIPLDAQGHLNQTIYDELLKQKPKLVCIAHISNVLGIENPVKEMATKAHEVGARFFLDAAQSLPHLPLDVRDLGVDFMACSAHKMYGPLGIGGLWIAPEAFKEMDPLASGGGAISHVGQQSYYLRQAAIQYEIGTPAVSQAIGWAAAVDYLESLGMDQLQKHSAILTRYLLDGLSLIPGLSIWGDHHNAAGQTGLVSFSLPGVTPAVLGKFCGDLGVAIRSGGHCALPLGAYMGLIGTGRASIAVHTTQEDIEALVVALETCRLINCPGASEELPK